MKSLSYWGEVPAEIAQIDVKVFGIEFDAHQEQAGTLVSVLVGVQNVSAVAIDEVRNSCDFTLSVRTTGEENGGVLHVRCVEALPQISCAIAFNAGSTLSWDLSTRRKSDLMNSNAMSGRDRLSVGLHLCAAAEAIILSIHDNSHGSGCCNS